MTWDWDKLQEKRQRQQGQRPSRPLFGDTDDSDTQDEPRRARRSPFGDGGNGNGFDGKNVLKKLSGMKMPGGMVVWLVLGLVGLWLLSGIYIVNPDEEGVVLRFGKYERTEGPGPHYALPAPIESVYKPQVTQVLRCEVGFRSTGQATTFRQGELRSVPKEASMLTGDENIVNVQFSVQYKISDAVKYLFNISDPTNLVRNAAEAAMREVIGNSLIDSAITDGKLKIQSDATVLLQQVLDRYEAGIQVLAVQMQDVHPPQEVSDAFKDVASAREDKSRIINEAEAYRRDILPKAQGQAAEIRNQAEAYRQTRVNAAQGEAQRFLSVLREYEKAEDVTKKRMLYETMEEIMSRPGMEKLVLPSDAASRVLPLLPLGEGFSGAGRPLTGNVPASDAADRSSASVSEPFSPPSSSSPVSAGSGQASPRVSRQDGDVRARAAAGMHRGTM